MLWQYYNRECLWQDFCTMHTLMNVYDKTAIHKTTIHYTEWQESYKKCLRQDYKKKITQVSKTAGPTVNANTKCSRLLVLYSKCKYKMFKTAGPIQ